MSESHYQLTGLVTDEIGQPLRQQDLTAQNGELVLTLEQDPVWIAPQARP